MKLNTYYCGFRLVPPIHKFRTPQKAYITRDFIYKEVLKRQNQKSKEHLIPSIHKNKYNNNENK